MSSFIFFGPPIIIFLIFTLIDLSNFKWVHLKLRRPSKKFVKGIPLTHEEYELSKINSDFFKYYHQYKLESLRNFEKEILLKSPRYVENNQLSSYFISLVTVFSLVIAAFATISSIINSDQTIYLVIFTGILVVTLAAYFMADLTTKTYNANLMERHLIVIRIVIQEKEKELQLEELRKQESKKLRESRLRKNIKSTPKDA